MILSKELIKDLVYQVNGAAIEVHKALGSGLLESIYHQCMIHELTLRGIGFKTELVIPINYKNFETNTLIKCDLLVEDTLVVEFKAVESVLPIHVAQLLTYMKLLKRPIGLMINFNCTHIFSEGQRTYVNEFYENIF